MANSAAAPMSTKCTLCTYPQKLHYSESHMLHNLAKVSMQCWHGTLYHQTCTDMTYVVICQVSARLVQKLHGAYLHTFKA